MQKRLGIARALIVEPEIILYDEPTAGLDPITSRTIADLIRELRAKAGSTLLTVTNDMQRAYQIGDRIFLLAQGRLLEGGTPAQVQATRESGAPAVHLRTQARSPHLGARMSIRFENVTKSFGAENDSCATFRSKSQTGEILFILGKSGMGKSVTLKHIVGVLKPDSGRVFVDGADVTALERRTRSPTSAANAGWSFSIRRCWIRFRFIKTFLSACRTPQYIALAPRNP